MATETELQEIEEKIVEDLEGGTQSTSIDGTSVSFVDPSKRIEALEKLEKRTARSSASSLNHFGLRFTKLRPPAGG